MTAYEIGYTGVLNRRATVTAAVYWNTTEDAIFFTQTASIHGLPIRRRDVAAADSDLRPEPDSAAGPAVAVLVSEPRDRQGQRDRARRGRRRQSILNVFVNYSYQADPDVEGFDPSETNFPANNRFNAGFNFNYGRFLGNFMVSYTGDAYWQDVLDQRFAGSTDAYTLVNWALV